jgi:hypothetical protein
VSPVRSIEGNHDGTIPATEVLLPQEKHTPGGASGGATENPTSLAAGDDQGEGTQNQIVKELT